jgi:hypothetical protein
LPGVVVDDLQAELTGHWATSASVGPYVQFGYRHDGNDDKGRKQARFEAKLAAGRYAVRVYCAPSSNRATNVPVTIRHAEGQTELTVNQQKPAADGSPYTELGVFSFGGDGLAVVEISNAGTGGYVILDAVQFVPQF